MFKSILIPIALIASSGAAFADPPYAGKWKSFACESRLNNQFLTRTFEFKPDGTWSGSFAFFADNTCSAAFSTFKAEGTYKIGAALPYAEGTVSANFILAKGLIEPKQEGAADVLNSAKPGTCGTEKWMVGAAQDITATGCSVFGITLPTIEHEIVYVRNDMLFFGARPFDGSNLDVDSKRPTTFQVPVVRAE
jgi:hypothetical protein